MKLQPSESAPAESTPADGKLFCWPRTVELTGVGLCTPLGVDVGSSVAHLRANWPRFRLMPTRDPAGEEVRAAPLDLLDDASCRTDRMAALAVTALSQCLQGHRRLQVDAIAAEHGRLGMFVGLPRAGDGGACDVQRLLDLLEACARRNRAAPAAVSVDWIGHGRGAVFGALEHAAAALVRGELRAAVVGVVDSLCDPESLGQLAASRRTLGTLNPDGIVPGEAAAFLLLRRSTSAHDRANLAIVRRARRDTHGMAAAAALLAVCTHEAEQAHGVQEHGVQEHGEQAHGVQDGDARPSVFELATWLAPLVAPTGACLTPAFRPGSDHEPQVRIHEVFSAQSGVSSDDRALARAYVRLGGSFARRVRTHRVAETLGDAGCAAAGVQLVHALQGAPRGGHPACRRAIRRLVLAHSDAGISGACLIVARRASVPTL